MISRTFDFHPADGGPSREVTATIAAPERDPKGPDWRVLVTLESDGAREEHHVYGVDGVQCAVEALFILPTFLLTFPGRGRITWLGGDDLGLTHRA